MSGKIVPWNWKKKRVQLGEGGNDHPILQLQRHLTKVLGDINSLMPESLTEPIQQLGERWGSFWPDVNVSRNERELIVTIELPGMDERDVELTLVPDGLVIRGEKRSLATAAGGTGYDHYTESSYGAFERIVTLNLEEFEQDKVDASSSKGIVTIKLPFKETVKSQAKKVPIRSVS